MNAFDSKLPLAEHLRGLEEALLRPEIRRDAAAVSALLTNDFCEFGISGRVYKKHEIVGPLAVQTPPDLTLHEFHCSLLAPSVALLTYRSERRESDGRIVSALRSSLWLQEAGYWRTRLHQGTRL